MSSFLFYQTCSLDRYVGSSAHLVKLGHLSAVMAGSLLFRLFAKPHPEQIEGSLGRTSAV